MPLKTVRVAQNQRGEAEDINDIGLLGLGNLTSALRGFVSPGTDGKITRGGLVYPTAPASKNVLIQPSAGFNPSGLPILLEAEDTKAIADNASGNPRIDLVSISVASVDTDEVPRKFWNPATETSFDANTDTRTELVTSVTVTQGVPGATPSPPATPAGHVPLARVAVANGMTSITDDDITMLDASLLTPVKYREWQWGPDYGVDGAFATAVALPYETPDLVALNTPAGSVTVLLAEIVGRVLSLSSSPPATHMWWQLRVHDGVSPIVVGATSANVDAPFANNPDSHVIVGIVPGGLGEVTVRVQAFIWSGSGTVRLSAEDLFDIPQINRLVAVTL